MLAVERRKHILDKLQEDRRVIVSELSLLYGVSSETIRRDLDRMDREGLATKSYGGAILNEDNLDLPFKVRKMRNMQGKRVIADLIRDLVEDGEHIIVDPSTTSLAVVKALKEKVRLSVITNSIEVQAELNEMTAWDVISTGGTIKSGYLALVGPRAVESIRSFNADTLIFSCKGLDKKKGVTDGNEMFAEVKQAMLRSASRKILAVDSSKFGGVAFSRICNVVDVDMVVTDVKPSRDWLAFFREKGIECLYGE